MQFRLAQLAPVQSEEGSLGQVIKGAVAVELPLAARRKRVAILVSRYDHCLLDLLWRSRRGEFEAAAQGRVDRRAATQRVID